MEPVLASECPLQKDLEMTWYENSFFNVHVDYHTRSDARTGAGISRSILRQFLGAVQPDMIQVHSKGHPGIASYPTKVGQVSSAHQEDVLAIYRDVCREMGVRFSVYYSSLVDAVAADGHEEWRIVKADGNFYGTGEKWEGDTMHSFFLCHNSGYVDQYLLPQIREILENYRPDGLWFDGDVWVSQVCYCASCEEKFGNEHSRQVPRNDGDEDWPLALRFCRDTYLDYLQKVRDLIREVHPDCLFSVNWLHTLRNPWASQGKVDWLSGDVPLNHGVKAAGREARFMNHQGLPFDIMVCDFSLDYRTRGYMYHKSAAQMEQEAAAVLANGARLFYWVTPTPEAAFRVEDPPTLAAVGKFARARQPFCTGTTSVPDLALLVSAAGWENDPKLQLETEDVHRVFAAHQMLVEAGLHHDLVSEEAFIDRGRDWPVALLPGVSHLSQGLVQALQKFVRRGGRLLLSLPLPAGSAALTGVEGWESLASPEDPLEKVALRALLPSGWARVFYQAARAHGGEAEPRGQLWDVSSFEPFQGVPVSYLHGLGRGQVATLAGNVFDGYNNVQAPDLRDLVLGELRFLHPRPLAELDPVGQLEVAVRQRPGEWLVHLVNHGADRDMGAGSYFVERVPDGGPRTLDLRCPSTPASATLQPGNRTLDWEATGDGIRCFLSKIGVHEIIQLRF